MAKKQFSPPVARDMVERISESQARLEKVLAPLSEVERQALVFLLLRDLGNAECKELAIRNPDNETEIAGYFVPYLARLAEDENGELVEEMKRRRQCVEELTSYDEVVARRKSVSGA